MSILDHVWGESVAADQVWSLVAGMRPRCAGQRRLMAIQAYIDESYTEGATFVMGGYLASAEAWSAFSHDWEEMLPYAVRDKQGKFHFHMREMAESPERMERVKPFYRIIEKHALMAVSCKIDISELARARQRIYVPGLSIDWGDMTNPWMVAYRCLLDMLFTYRERFLSAVPQSEKIDFIFDDHSAKKVILSTWDEYIELHDGARALYGAAPIFRDDKEFLPLQAADLWAWWVRHWHEIGEPWRIEESQFGDWKGAREQFYKVDIQFDEDALAKNLAQQVASLIEPGRPVYNVKFSMG